MPTVKPAMASGGTTREVETAASTGSPDADRGDGLGHSLGSNPDRGSHRDHDQPTFL